MHKNDFHEWKDMTCSVINTVKLSISPQVIYKSNRTNYYTPVRCSNLDNAKKSINFILGDYLLKY